MIFFVLFCFVQLFAFMFYAAAYRGQRCIVVAGAPLVKLWKRLAGPYRVPRAASPIVSLLSYPPEDPRFLAFGWALFFVVAFDVLTWHPPEHGQMSAVRRQYVASAETLQYSGVFFPSSYELVFIVFPFFLFFYR